MLHLFFLTWVPVSRVVGGIPEERLFFYLRPYWFYRTACYHEHKRLGVNSSVTIAISIVGQSRGISIAGHVFNAAATNWFTMMIIFFFALRRVSLVPWSSLKPQISTKDVFQVRSLILIFYFFLKVLKFIYLFFYIIFIIIFILYYILCSLI